MTLICVLLVFACLVENQAFADFSRSFDYSGATTPSRFEQRKQYLHATHLIRTSQFTAYNKLKPGLRTYPLYPYLEYLEFSHQISRQSEADIVGFIEQHQDTPLIEPLLQHWLLNLARRSEWTLFVKYYDKVTPTTTLACHYGYALSKTGQTELAMHHAAQLWLVDFSQPDECDPIFRIWQAAGGLSGELAWHRFSLTLRARKTDLATYLTRFLDREDKQFATRFMNVAKKPATLEHSRDSNRDHPRNREIVLFGIDRLARSEPEKALSILNRYQAIHTYDPGQLDDSYVAIGIRLSRLTRQLANDDLPVNLHNHPDLVEARLREALRLSDGGMVLVLINLLPDELQASARWQYWKARVLATSIDPADRATAQKILISLAAERTFYGFLAADQVGQDYNFQDDPAPVSLEEVLAMEESTGIRRALELFALGERPAARREWYFSTANFNVTERKIAARVALRWGFYKAAIQSMIDGQTWNHLDFRFPLAYQDTFVEHARRANIPVQWSLAIARQESAFMPDARSPAGALGVMQLMPATAKIVANRLGLRLVDNTELTRPDFNIQLGTDYLGEMLRKFDNNRILASAAYNAGPGRVTGWLDPSLAYDVWIESIPFTETRDYVQNVLMFSAIYSRRMNEHQPLIYANERNTFTNPQISWSPAPILIVDKNNPAKSL